MDTLTTILTMLAVAMLITTWLGFRQGSERRDVSLMATLTGALGAGAVAAFVI